MENYSSGEMVAGNSAAQILDTIGWRESHAKFRHDDSEATRGMLSKPVKADPTGIGVGQGKCKQEWNTKASNMVLVKQGICTVCR